jgi:DMSO reductase family type II enzyme heme b subunit
MGQNEGVFNPGRATGNILSDAGMRVSAVEDLNAEGFSTLTTQAHQDVQGEGNWRNNRWAVVFKRALKTGDSNDTQFGGGKTPMAIAIWNGGNKERNGQKAVTQWNTLHY